jgi:predicted RNA-binding protein
METRRELEDFVRPHITSAAEDADVESGAARAFYEYLVSRYRPPADKRLLVFFQCSVRRPFSKSPSHGSLRRAVAAATGYDPAREFARCPVHVVVVSSTLGPVPYELEEVYPASVGRAGVKQLGYGRYARVRPILAERVAGYLRAHGEHYERAAAFTQGRYGEVMADALAEAGGAVPIFPRYGGPKVVRMGSSVPRTYWQKYWIQLCLEVVRWLPAAEQERAAARLRMMQVEYG